MPPSDTAPPDECYRCGYDLRGIDNARACPECGLLAERSRHVTDELHDTRPRWLRKITIGITLILIAILIAFIWICQNDLITTMWEADSQFNWWYMHRISWTGLLIASTLLFIGALFLSAREGYLPADVADSRLRILLRFATAVPLLASLVIQGRVWYLVTYTSWSEPSGLPFIAALVLCSAGCVPLPLLLFYRLRGLAKRARSAHLAEHCAIIGLGTSLSFAYFGIAWMMLRYGDHWLGQTWIERSIVPLTVMLVFTTAAGLFILWSLYLMTCFAVAFARASLALRRKWTAQDRSITPEKSFEAN